MRAERLRHIPFAPRAGRRCRQAEGQPHPTHSQKNGPCSPFLHLDNALPAQLARAAARRRSLIGW
ncbi:hypothetical protein EOS93_06150 [Rhizobium sp. RMa-01]|nr:hypothetical protein EOS93_06150 [Rhizobium sp. RMa-01]